MRPTARLALRTGAALLVFAATLTAAFDRSGAPQVGTSAHALSVLGCKPPYVKCLGRKLVGKVNDKMKDILGFDLGDLKKLVLLVVDAGKCILVKGAGAVKQAISSPASFFKDLFAKVWKSIKTIGLRTLNTFDIRHLWKQIKGLYGDVKRLAPKELTPKGMIKFAMDVIDALLARGKGEARRMTGEIWKTLLEATRNGPAPLGCLSKLSKVFDLAKGALQTAADTILGFGRKVFRKFIAPKLADILGKAINWVVTKVLSSTKLGKKIRAAIAGPMVDRFEAVDKTMERTAQAALSGKMAPSQAVKDEINRFMDTVPAFKLGFWLDLVKDEIKAIAIDWLNDIGDKIIYYALAAVRAIVINLANKVIGWFTGTVVPGVVESVVTSVTAGLGPVGSFITSASSTIGEVLIILIRWVWDTIVDPILRQAATFILQTAVDVLINGVAEYLYQLVKKYGIDKLDEIIANGRRNLVNRVPVPKVLEKVLKVLLQVYEKFVAPAVRPMLQHAQALRGLAMDMLKPPTDNYAMWKKLMRRRGRSWGPCGRGKVRRAGQCVPKTGPKRCKRPGYERVAGKCVKKCKQGYQRVGGTCQPKCKRSQELVGGRCVSRCGRKEERVGSQCRPKCSGNQERAGDRCVSACGSGQERVRGRCVTACPNGQERVGTVCQVKCKAREERQGTQCVCTSGYKRATAGLRRGRCVPRCRSGMELVGDTCKATCGVGFARDENTGKCKREP